MNVIRRLPRALPRVSPPSSLLPPGERWPRPILFSTACRSLQRQGENEYDVEARKLNEKRLDEHEQEVKVRQHQVRRPWHRHDADKPPVDSEGKGPKEPITKGTANPGGDVYYTPALAIYDTNVLFPGQANSSRLRRDFSSLFFPYRSQLRRTSPITVPLTTADQYLPMRRFNHWPFSFIPNSPSLTSSGLSKPSFLRF